jgi:hypothetical protein
MVCAHAGSPLNTGEQVVTNWFRSTITPSDESKLLIATKYGCDLDAMLP